MKCKYPNCGKLRDDSRHDFITINMPICLEYHPFEPAEPEAAAPRRFPLAHYFCAECEKTPEPCHHFFTTQATEARPEIHTVGFKPLMGETKDSSRCSLDGAARIPLNREGTKFGACTLVNGEDGKGGCKDPLHDYELEQKSEAAAQKVEQPAVEPQQFCPVCSFGWDGIKCKFCHHEKSDEIKPEAGSTRPEMPPSPWLMCKCGYGKIHHEGKDLVCPNNFGGVLTVFSEADNVPPANELKALDALEQMVASARTHYSRNHDDSLKQAIVTLKSQPAAPRTQGREWKRQESYPECDGDGCNNCAPEDWAWAAAHELIFPDDECGDRYSDVDTKEAAKVIRKHFELAQARTQPAPKCPKCGSAEIYLYTTECIVRCPNCREVYPTLHVKDFAQFFSALPEATKEEK